MIITTPPTKGQQQSENHIDIAGFSAWDDPFLWENCSYTRSRDEFDKASLRKLWETGFDVPDLQTAHDLYRISPVRVVSDLWKLLGFVEAPVNPNGTARFSEADLTALAIAYPNPRAPGEVYPAADFIRLRYARTIRAYSKYDKKYTDQKYGQPKKESSTSHAEPYFLPVREQWDRVYDATLPLLITEGELKGAALAFARTAGIAFPGITMWAADSKAGKHRIHPALDPYGQREKWAIPIQKRMVVLIPDGDFRANKSVRDSAALFGKALLDAGAEVFTVHIPSPPVAGAWKGVDDYLTAHLGERWAGDAAKVDQANELVAGLIEHHSVRGNRTDWNHPATTADRAALRMEKRYRQPEKYTATLVEDNGEGQVTVGWLMYNDDHYEPVDVYRTIGNTSGKVAVNTDHILKHALDEWQRGIKIARDEGDIEGKVPGMPADFANRTLAILAQQLDTRGNDTLIEPFGSVREGDKCLRIRNALINLTRFFELGGTWDNRIEWLLPSDYRWFGSGYLSVSLSNLRERPTCPLFLDMLGHAFLDDQARIDCLQLWFGKILCSPMFLGRQQFLALYGKAGSGKSTIYRILLKLLGDSAVIELRANMGGRFDTSGLPGKRLVVYEETPDGDTGKFDPYMADVIKQITGQDRVVCEAKGMKAVPHRIDAEVITIGNTPPIIPMDEGAFRRRAILLKLSRPLRIQDSTVEERMVTTELPGILMWALDGAAKLFAGARITTPAACEEDLTDVTTAVSPEEQFVTTGLKVQAKGEVTPTQLLDAFREWLIQHSIRYEATNSRKIGYLIRERFGIGSTTVNRGGKVFRAYVGIGFTSAAY